MRHLFLAESDYAASGAAFMLALQTTGEECRYLAARSHQYEYPHQPDSLIPRNKYTQTVLADAVAWAQCVWIIQTDVPIAMGGIYGARAGQIASQQREQWLRTLHDKHVVLLHGGGHYRDNREEYAALWRPFRPVSLCYEADLMGGFEDEHLVVPPLDPAWMTRVQRSWPGLRIGHFPSRPTDKGSEWIVPMLESRPHIDFRTSVTDPTKEHGVNRVPWPQQLQRMAGCDAVIDQVKPELNGQPFGEWVSIGLEAAMCGRISIANSRNPAPYVATYGRDPGIHICNTPAELAHEVDRLYGLTEARLIEEQRESYAWAVDNHSLLATGRLLSKLLGLRPKVHPLDAERIDEAMRAQRERGDGTLACA